MIGIELVQVDEAAGDDLGPADDRAGLLVDRHDDHEHPVVGERLAIAQHDVADLADRQPVHVDVAGRHRLATRALPSAENSIGVPFSMMKTLSGMTPGLDRQATVLDLHPELAVHRDEVLRDASG
jgi:hypothetical protein